MLILKILNTAVFFALVSSYIFKDLTLTGNWEIYTALTTITLTALGFIPKASRKIYEKQGMVLTFSQTIVFSILIVLKFNS
jgi:hypothetical protein